MLILSRRTALFSSTIAAHIVMSSLTGRESRTPDRARSAGSTAGRSSRSAPESTMLRSIDTRSEARPRLTDCR